MSDLGPDAGGRTPGAGRWVRIALAVSLSLNLLILGLVSGIVLNRGGPDEAPAIRTLGLGPFALALPREARDGIRGRIESDLPALRGERIAIGRSLREVQRALLAEPFDRDAAERALARSREAAIALQGIGHAALLDTLTAMEPAERALVAQRLGRVIRRSAPTGGPRQQP